MRYIDEDLIPYVESENGVLDDFAYRYDINEIPTADVVPKSEVDGWREVAETNMLVILNMQDELTNAKAEVDRLEAELAKAKEKAERMQRNLEGVLEERDEYPTEVVREIFAEIDRAVENAELEWGTICGVKLCIAELKKKYTEESK